MKSIRMGLTGTLLAGAAGLGTLGCDVQRALDCAQLALEVTSSVDALARAVDAEDPAGFSDAADTAQNDLDELRDGFSDTDVSAAADSVAEAIENIAQQPAGGSPPDLSPLNNAVDELTSACASND
ncbi:hypothetical protein [Streptomyces profundus]|uniref:hypothetical protein n=1 Tax=Streptomyces profundus TaxID=2867410 RepID=UPI001D16A6CF|nr:hypothetical protein [Streptomyces sp. MA3_2.13]UED86081.1 hypothetical protein K4G22_19360 [Streptomyces sp. MA3_2.13]